MGWTSFHLNEPVKEWFKHEWNEKMVVLDSAIVKRNTLYAAMHNTITGEIFCAVFLLRWSRNHYNFSYKSMTEHVGPNEIECPLRIMKLLTPLDDKNDSSGWAREWRKKVYEYWDAQKKLNSGEYVVKTDEPVKFNNGMHFGCFKREGKYYLAGELQINGVFASFGKVRLNLKHYKYSLVKV
jgi:hypothetical protein